MNKVLKVKCPTCSEKFNYYNSEFRPFCCEKCKMVDLGLWLTESYAVPAIKQPDQKFDEFDIPQDEASFFREDDE